MIEVEEGRADYGSSSHREFPGRSVIDNYDNLLKHDIYIVAETKVAVDHALLGLPEASLEDIRRVYSHPQGLMQCSGYLGAHRQWSQISVENTAGAAKKVLEEGEVSQAAVASPTAGALTVLRFWRPPSTTIRTIPPGSLSLPGNPCTGRMRER